MKSWRINLVLAIVIVFSAAIISRLIYIQAVNNQYWLALAQGQQKFFVALHGERGGIFFKFPENSGFLDNQNKTSLAINRNFDLVYAAPNEIKNPEEVSEKLSSILNLNKNSILEKFKKDTLYEVIKKKLTEEEVNNIKNLNPVRNQKGSNGVNLTGIYLGQESGRYYPFENLASQVIGFLGGDGQGQYGIEGYYNETLKGKEEFKELEKGPGGYFINSGENYILSAFSNSPSRGSDLVLTIDYNIQFMAEKLLREAKENLKFESGEIIVMDPNSGKILALVNLPDFNPNQYSEEDMEVFQNSSIQKIFEPGSVFKPITMAAALNEEKITPQTAYVDKGFLKIGGHTILNYGGRAWGERTMTEVLEKSINTGAVFAEEQIGHDTFLEYIKRFGFFEKTGIDLEGEIFSQNQELKKGYEINFATAAFGQGIEMTSIQLSRAFSAIANGGKLLKPYLVDKIFENGKMVETRPQVQNSSVISQKTASQLTLMLVNVVEKGYGKKAGVPGYYIAGKTGTAQVPEAGVYSAEKTIQSFIGFGPALDPKFLILVKFYNPKTKSAEYSAAPIFGELAKYITDYWQIPPDH